MLDGAEIAYRLVPQGSTGGTFCREPRDGARRGATGVYAVDIGPVLGDEPGEDEVVYRVHDTEGSKVAAVVRTSEESCAARVSVRRRKGCLDFGEVSGAERRRQFARIETANE